MVPAGDDRVHRRDLVHQLGEGVGGGEGDAARVDDGPRPDDRRPDARGHAGVIGVPRDQPYRVPVVDQTCDELRHACQVRGQDRLTVPPVLGTSPPGHDADGHRRPRSRLHAFGQREGERQVRVDRVAGGVDPHAGHSVAGRGVTVGAVRRRARGPPQRPPRERVAGTGSPHADEDDRRAGEPSGERQTQQRVREAPGVQRQRVLEHAHPRDDHCVDATQQAHHPKRVEDLADGLESGRPGTGPGRAVEPRPRHRHRGDPVPAPDVVGTGADGRQLDPGVPGQLGQHRLQRSLVADVP